MYSSFSDDYSLFEEQVSNFKKAAASAGDILREMLSTLDAGMVPSIEHISSFQSILHKLQGDYNIVYKTATGLLENISCPQEGCSIADLTKSIDRLKEQVFEKLRELEKILSEFLTIESNVTSYMEALQTWRSKASELLVQIRSQKCDHDALNEAVEPYRLFLKAMDMEDSDEKEILFSEKIDALFPGIVSRGLYSGKYYKSNRDETKLISGVKDTKEDATIAPQETPPLLDVNKTTTVVHELNSTQSIDTSQHHKEKTNLDSNGCATNNYSMAQTECAANKDRLPCDSYDEEKKCDLDQDMPNNINTRTISRPSDIKNFISNNMKNGAVALLSLLQAFRIITTEQIIAFGKICKNFIHISDSKINSMLTLLATKKVIKRINHPLALWVMTSQNNDSIDDIFKNLNIQSSNSFINKRSYPEKISEIDIVDTISYNERLINYLLGIQKFSPHLFSDVLNTVELYNTSIKISVVWKQEPYICSLALPEEMLDEKKEYRLFVPISEENLFKLKDVPADVTCFAFYEGTLYRWEQGNWHRNLAHTLESAHSFSMNPAKDNPGENFAKHGDSDLTTGEVQERSSGKTAINKIADAQALNLQDAAEEKGIPACESVEAVELEAATLPGSLATHPVYYHDETLAPCSTEDDAPVTDGFTEQSIAHKENVEETVEQMAARLAKRDGTPSSEEIVTIVVRLFEQNAESDFDRLSRVIAQALMLLKAAVLQGLSGCISLYEQLALATGTAQGTESYTGYNLNEHFTAESNSQSLTLAAYMYALFAPTEQDFTLQNQAKMYLHDYETYFPAYPVLKPLFAVLCEIRDVEPRGFSASVLAQLENEEEKATSMRKLQKRAEGLMSEPVVTVHLNGIPALLSNCFGHKSDYYACMEIIAQNKLQDKEIVEDILRESYDLKGKTYELNEKKIDTIIDSAWAAATKNLSTQRLPLKMVGRRQIRQAFLDRLDLMKEWVESAEPLDSGRADKLRRLQHSILRELNALPFCCAAEGNKDAYAGVVSYITKYLSRKLEQRKLTPLFSDALRTGFIELDDRFQPIIEKGMCDIPYYEPWRRVLKHIACSDTTLEDVERVISNDSHSPMFDNLQQLELLTRLLHENEDIRESSSAAEKRAKEKTKDFKGKLELAYAAGRITEQDKEDLLQMLFYEEEFCSRRNFGCWNQFLDALQLYQNSRVALHKRELEEQIAQRKNSAPSSHILETAEQLLTEGQFAIAEEFVNIFDRGDNYQSEEFESIFDEDNRLEEFLQPKNFDPLYDYSMTTLRGRALRKVGPDFLKKHFPDGWTTAYKDESIKFVQSWPNAKTKTTPQDIQNFMTSLGITVSKVTAVQHKKEDMFEVGIEPVPCDRPDYPHPIAAFGTEMKSPLTVVALYGGKQANDIRDTVNQLRPSAQSITIVLLDYALSRSVRCQLAEVCHQSSGLARFIVIDRVLVLYLALHQRSERMSILLSCALPYASALQPFVRDGGPTSAEMFCGRTRELRAILDLSGAILIYGGRQLGKTALLQRARSSFHNPVNKNYAVFCSIKEISEETDLVLNIIDEINKQTSLNIQHCSTMKTLCDKLDRLFREKKIQTMLLLLDEADKFLRSEDKKKYTAVQPLVELRRSQSMFKFVFAGLNNVYRARNATMNNGVFGQIGHPLCIKPLSPADALRLILRPLRYLGFKPGKGAHLETILSSTNYYPGILQFVGYNLAESLNSPTSRYYRPGSETPPVQLTNDHLGSIMAQDDLNESIKEKFRLSLNMDERYFMLARCIGMLYHFGESMYENYKGYTVEQIKYIVDIYDIRCLKGLDREGYETLLDEMFEMGILHRAQEGVYRLRKRSFLDIIGSDMTRLENEIIDENKRGQKDA